MFLFWKEKTQGKLKKFYRTKPAITFWVTRVLLLNRFKMLGPDGSNYLSSQEAQAVGSDADDAWLAIHY
jgi:hypothetical protein